QAGSDYEVHPTRATFMTVHTNGAGLPLRATPSTSSRVIDTVPDNTELFVYGGNGVWSYAGYLNDYEGAVYYGYVENRYLQIVPNY
ncbi:MAG: SH3 domain-containing protein, partial [Ruminococcus flavefaciens]